MKGQELNALAHAEKGGGEAAHTALPGWDPRFSQGRPQAPEQASPELVRNADSLVPPDPPNQRPGSENQDESCPLHLLMHRNPLGSCQKDALIGRSVGDREPASPKSPQLRSGGWSPGLLAEQERPNIPTGF